MGQTVKKMVGYFKSSPKWAPNGKEHYFKSGSASLFSFSVLINKEMLNLLHLFEGKLVICAIEQIQAIPHIYSKFRVFIY